MRFLENILGELRRARAGPQPARRRRRLLAARKRLTRSPSPRSSARSRGRWRRCAARPPDEIEYPGGSEPLREVWLALRANIRQVLESVTLADVVAGALPEPIGTLAQHPERQPAPRHRPIRPRPALEP